jgi:hypothetical protein
MDMVDYTDGHGGLHRWTWWTTQMEMVDYTDGHGGLHRWTWWTAQINMVDYVIHHIHLCSPPCPSV